MTLINKHSSTDDLRGKLFEKAIFPLAHTAISFSISTVVLYFGGYEGQWASDIYSQYNFIYQYE